MKVKADLLKKGTKGPGLRVSQAEKLSTCFRAGMAAHETLCHLFEMVKIVREPSFHKLGTELRTQGVQALEKAGAEALRLRELLTVGGGAAGVVARKTKLWAAELRKIDPKKVDHAFRKKSQEKLHQLGQDVAAMYEWSLGECGKKVKPGSIMTELYPERKPR